MATDWSLDAEIDQAYDILDQESQETVEAFRNNDPSHHSMDHLSELIQVLGTFGGDVEDGLLEQQSELNQAIDNLRAEAQIDREKDSLAHNLESSWENFEAKVEEEFQRAEAQKETRTDRLADSISGTLGSITGSEEEESGDSDFGSRGPDSSPNELSSLVEDIEQRFLNPLLRDEENVTEQQKALESLTQVLKYSVKLHQEANKYKLILLHAKRDTHLQEELAEHTRIDWFNNAVMEARQQEQRLEVEVQKIMDAEEQFISSLEEAHELLEKVLELDKDVLETISEASKSKRRRDKVIGALATGDDHLLEKLSLIDSVYDNDFSPVIQRLADDLRPKVAELERMEDVSIREEGKLAEEIEQYLEEHRRLMQQDKEEMERERDNLTLEGPVEDVRNGAPRGTEEYISIIEDLRKLLNKNVLEDVRAAEQDYRRIYRVDEDEIEKVHDFVGRARELRKNLTTLEHQFVNGTTFRNAFQAQKGPEKLHREMEKLMNGEPPFEVGLRPVADNIQKLQADVQKIYTDEEKEKNLYHRAHEDLEREIAEVQRIKDDFERLEELVEHFRDPNLERNSVNGESHPYRAYHDVFITASKHFYGGADKESQLQLHQLLKDITQEVQEIKQEIANQRDLIGEVIGEEHMDEEGLKEALEIMDACKEDLEEAFQGDIEDPIPNPVSRKLDQIDNAIERIEEELGDIEESTEAEEAEAGKEFDETSNMFDDIDEGESFGEFDDLGFSDE